MALSKKQFDFKKGQEKRNWLLNVILAWGGAILGIFLATVAGSLLNNADSPDWIWKLVQGVIFTTVVILVMLFLQRRKRINIWSYIHLSSVKKGIPYLVLGGMMQILLLIIVLFIAQAFGWISFQGFYFSTDLFYAFLVNVVIAFLYEAFPEEVVFRGFLYKMLETRMKRFLAIISQVVLFILFPIVLAGLQLMVGMNAPPITVPYIVLLLIFGLTLQLIRLVTRNLWTSIGFHLIYLECARFVLNQNDESFLVFDETIPGVAVVMVIPAMVLLSVILAIVVRKTKLDSNVG